MTATLDLYVNGTFRQALTLSSAQTWGYEGNNHYNNETQNPSDGNPRTFFDEIRTFVTGTAIAPGNTFRLQKIPRMARRSITSTSLTWKRLPQLCPSQANSLSITSYGAVGKRQQFGQFGRDTKLHQRSSIPGKECVDSFRHILHQVPGWVEREWNYDPGRPACGIVKFIANVPLPNSTPLGAIFNVTSCTVRNFALDSNAKSRQSADGAGGGMDTGGNNWLAEGIWTQHTLSGFWASGTGGTVRNCRLTSIWADGCNLNNVSLGGTVGNNLTASNNFVRGTGDDALAINSVNYNGSQTYTPMQTARIVNNTSIAMWGGKGVGFTAVAIIRFRTIT